MGEDDRGKVDGGSGKGCAEQGAGEEGWENGRHDGYRRRRTNPSPVEVKVLLPNDGPLLVQKYVIV